MDGEQTDGWPDRIPENRMPPPRRPAKSDTVMVRVSLSQLVRCGITYVWRVVEKLVRSGVTKVSPGAVNNGVTLFYLKKVMTFLVIVLQTTARNLSASPGDRFIRLSIVFFVNSLPHNFILSLGCHPLNGVTPASP